MTIHVNIGEAKTRLSELIAAALKGEEVVLDKAGVPQVRLQPVVKAGKDERQAMVARRLAAIGMYKEAFKGVDLSLEALKAHRVSLDERARRIRELAP